jgi:hypothetical protein
VEQTSLRSEDADFIPSNLDPLGDGLHLMSAITSSFGPELLARGARKPLDNVRRDFDRSVAPLPFRPLDVGPRSVTNHFELGQAAFQILIL